jgi:hypothetical protein
VTLDEIEMEPLRPDLNLFTFRYPKGIAGTYFGDVGSMPIHDHKRIVGVFLLPDLNLFFTRSGAKSPIDISICRAQPSQGGLLEAWKQ